MEKIYTTGRIAKLCQVAPRTVSKWIDSGRLRGYRIPGSQDRRVTSASLAKFLNESGFDPELIPDDLAFRAETPRVLVIGADEDTFADAADLEFTHVKTPFAAGIAFAEVKPSCVVVDVQSLGQLDAVQIARTLRGAGAFVVAIVADLAADPKLTRSFGDVLAASPDPAFQTFRLQRSIAEANEPATAAAP